MYIQDHLIIPQYFKGISIKVYNDSMPFIKYQ